MTESTKPNKQPFLWGCLTLWAVLLPSVLCVVSTLHLLDDYRFLQSASERATAVLTKAASGHGVLRFEAEGRVVEVRGGPASSGWGSSFDVRFPKGQPEQARTERGLRGRVRQSWQLLIGGILLAVVFFIARRSIINQERNHALRSTAP